MMATVDAHAYVRDLVIASVMIGGMVSTAAAQDERRIYAGGLFGISTLSADGRAVTMAPRAEVSLYKPENGPALSVLAGMHLTRFVAVQATYVWNGNDLTLLSSVQSPERSVFYEQARSSQQHIASIDTLVFVRHRESRIRPYLSAGIGVLRFSSGRTADLRVNGLMPPEDQLGSTQPVLRVAVGIDIRIARRGMFRYTYGQTLSGNPVSDQLMPKGERALSNFHSLFGWVWQP